MTVENGKGWKDWILHVLLALVLTFGGTIWAMESSARSQEREDLKSWKAVVDLQRQDQRDRIIVLETKYESIERNLTEINRKLDDLKAKR